MSALTNTWRHIRRSPYQAISAISIMTLTFIVAGIFAMLSFSSYILLKNVEQKPQIIVFFNDVKKEADIKILTEKLQKNEKVAAVKYVSKDEALTIYKEQFKNDPLLLEMVSADILPASIEVSAVKLDYLSELVADLKKEPDVQDVAYPKTVIDQLLSWINTIRNIGLGLMIVLGVVSVITVMTIVNMKIALKRSEIEILQLIGASSWYVRLPFILEGIFYGTLGAFFGYGINLGILYYLQPLIENLFIGIPLFPIPSLMYAIFFAIMLGLGIVLGALSSMIALMRYLR